MEITISVGLLVALVWKLADLSKYITNKDWNGFLTQIWVYVLGVVVLLVAGNANAFEALTIPGMTEPLGTLDTLSLVIIGLAIASMGSTFVDFKKAFDGSDSAKTKPLIPSQADP